MTSEQILLYGILGLILLLYTRKKWLSRGIAQYTPEEVKKKVNEGCILLDVRTKGERSSSSISKSIHIPLHELSSRLSELKKYQGKEIICYCASGSRSMSAAVQLKKAGLKVGNLKGGIAAWNFSNL